MSFLDPALRRKLGKFREDRLAFWSLVLLALLFFVSLFAEGICNDHPFVVRYQGSYYFPLFHFTPGAVFGEKVNAEADYKALRASARFRDGKSNFMLFPPVPYGPNESMASLSGPPPTPPSRQNWLGTDDRGRDLLTRLVYGFRSSMCFALFSWALLVVVAYCVGATQGYLGGRVDFLGQRFTEVWNALPVLYVVVFLLSLCPPSLPLLALVWVAFSWIPLASYVRAEVLKVRKLEFVTAARALGLSRRRILFRHILPNAITPLITLSPFVIAAAVGSLAALDYLGLGLPPPTASWGELLREGKDNLSSWWLAFFPFFSLFATLLLLSFIGEGLRSTIDPRHEAGPP